MEYLEAEGIKQPQKMIVTKEFIPKKQNKQTFKLFWENNQIIFLQFGSLSFKYLPFKDTSCSLI